MIKLMFDLIGCLGVNGKCCRFGRRQREEADDMLTKVVTKCRVVVSSAVDTNFLFVLFLS